MTAMRPTVSLAVSAWVSWSQRHAKAVVAAIAILTAVLAFYAATHLSVDTNTEHLLSPQLPWRRAVAQLDREFPQLSNTLVIVIDGATPELAEVAEEQLLRELSPRKDLFVELFALDAEPFFRRNGLLFLDRAELDSVQSSLIRAQPFLGTLDSHPTLASLFTLLTRALERPDTGFDLAPALGQLGHAVGQVNAGRFDRLSWALLTGNSTGAASPRAKRFIEIAPRFEFDRLLPAGRGIDFIRATARRLQLTPDRGVTVRLTGSVAMEHEELLTAVTGAGISLGAALVMIAVLLYLALRSARLVITAVLTLITGLVFTAAFAAFAVGHLNMISVAFGVLYVGLGIDYALYISMEYRELLSRGEPPHSAIPSAARRMGGFMVICAATTSIAFLAFVPTPFTAIAELGAISAFGMLMSFFMSITLLPALVRLMPPDPGRVTLRPDRFGALSTWPYRHGRALWIGAGIAACGALALLPRVHFDADPIDLRDPKSESVATYRELVQNPEIPTLTLSALANDVPDAQRLAERLAALPAVKQVLTLQSFIPEDQPAKLAIVEDLALALGPDFTDEPGPTRAIADPADESSLQDLIARLRATPAAATDVQSRAARGLLTQLERFQTSLDSQRGPARAELLGRLRETLLGTLPIVLRDVRDTLKASMVSIDDLPAALISRWRSPQGHYRVEAAPREMLIGIPPMQRFLNEVRSVAPQAVGPPLVILESANAVVSAFRRAFAFSAIAIVLLLIVLLRRPADVLLAIVPLVFAGLFTAAGMALLGLSFNFANVIALPLILGVGIDYGVYIVQRGRESEAAAANLLRSGAARAVFFGALITIASFGNLVWSRHPGTVSLGLVLTLGLALTLTSALVFLPSLLLARQRRLAVKAARAASDRRPER